MKCFALLLVLLLTGPGWAGKSGSAGTPTISWQTLAAGLQLGEYYPALKSTIGDSKITILKVSPQRYAFRLLTAAEHHDQRHTAAQWCQQEKLVACINAGMYEPDGRNTGYMRNSGQQLNSVFNADNCLLAFNPTDTLRPALKLIDRGCEADWEQQVQHYQSVSQSIRLIDCQRRNTWSAQPRKWSASVWGIAGDGQALLIFCRSPYPMHDLADILLEAPLNLRQAMYLEGGPEASLYVKGGGTERNLFGSYETGFMENDDVREAFPLPNVIGIVKR